MIGSNKLNRCTGDVPFEMAVLRLIEGDAYIDYQHLLEVIPTEQETAFLELLGAGTQLRACFKELDAFLSWQATTLPSFLQDDIVVDSVPDQVSLYLLDKVHRPTWLAWQP